MVSPGGTPQRQISQSAAADARDGSNHHKPYHVRPLAAGHSAPLSAKTASPRYFNVKMFVLNGSLAASMSLMISFRSRSSVHSFDFNHVENGVVALFMLQQQFPQG